MPERGERGPQGDLGHGETGERGQAGERGEHGQHGQLGQRGEAGERGPRGDTGETGQTGQRGETGAAYPERRKDYLAARERLTKILRLAVLGYLVLFGGFLYGLYRLEAVNNAGVKDSRQQDIAIVESQRDGCELANDNREALRESFQIELQENRRVTHDLFPDIPKERFDELIDTETQSLRRQIRNIPPIDCEELYPIPPEVDG